MIQTLIVIALIFIDQITKYLATTYLKPVGTMPFIPGIMELRYVLNDGAAFSIFSGNKWFLIVFTSIMLIGVIIYSIIKKPTKFLEKTAFILIISGGIGNLIDRVLYGYVVDFFATTFMNFAVFNVADCFVVIGACFLIITTIIQEFEISKKNKRQNSPQSTKEQEQQKLNNTLNNNDKPAQSDNNNEELPQELTENPEPILENGKENEPD